MAQASTRPDARSEMLAEFETYCADHAGLDLSRSTANKYRRYAEHFLRDYGPLSRTTRANLAEWNERIATTDAGQPAAASTINVKVAAIRALCEFAVARGQRTDNPTDGQLKMRTVPDRLPRPFAPDELQRVLRLAFSATPTPEVLQDRAIMAVLYGSGLRRSEAASLRLKNILTPNSMSVVGKGDKERVTVITPPEYHALQQWLLHQYEDARIWHVRAEFNETTAFSDLRRRFPDGPVFFTRTGEPASAQFIWTRCLIYFTEAKIENATPHRFRHSFATNLLDHGADLVSVSRLLGHDDLETTKQYLGLTTQGLARSVAAHPWQSTANLESGGPDALVVA